MLGCHLTNKNNIKNQESDDGQFVRATMFFLRQTKLRRS
jgi:hypothetical protein